MAISDHIICTIGKVCVGHSGDHKGTFKVIKGDIKDRLRTSTFVGNSCF
uniref:Uncharacterized protein n=1 Tax=virus sp. ctqq75 TaxID=2827999 RepID=A0A8S5RE50_9VIRU|nr:MAG TPA: hypothetical protein [virus sp. ctqq75]DAU76776.1 MAG TPA: hypothetical protein [Caudoviricetes sp.]